MSTLFVFLFLVIFGIVAVAVGIGLKYYESQRSRKVSGMLQTVSGKEEEVYDADILRQEEEKTPSFLAQLNFLQPVSENLRQSGLGWSLPRLLVLMLLSGAVGVFIGLFVPVLIFAWASSLGLGMLFALLPYVYVKYKRKKRTEAFEAQLPEALDFLARSMKAGHAFSVSLGMLAEESPDPLGIEFRIVYNEQNLGAPLDIALKNMLKRMPLLDLRFFVSSVLLQKDTGGNLAEILSKLAYVIRERFRLKMQVRAVSAHGRLTATVLIIMPIVTMILLMFMAPGYLQGMAKDPDGKYLIVGAVIGQILGIYFIRSIIDIKV